MFTLLDFVYDNCLFKQYKVNDLLFVEYKCVADESILKVWSQHNYFLYVISGKKVWQTPHKKYEVTAGQAIFVKKGANIVHQFFDNNFCSLIIFVPDHFISELIQHNAGAMTAANCSDIPSDTVIPINLDEALTTYFLSVFAYFRKRVAPPKDLLEIKFKELILNLTCSSQNESLCAYFKSLCSGRKTSIREVMEANFTYNIKLTEFAQLCGRSLTTFKRDFTSIYHTSPGRWLVLQRLSYARQLLETSDKNINELAYESGFENVSHFIKTFRETFGMPPLQFKRSVLALSEG